MPIKQDFGKATAIVIARAKKQNAIHSSKTFVSAIHGSDVWHAFAPPARKHVCLLMTGLGKNISLAGCSDPHVGAWLKKKSTRPPVVVKGQSAAADLPHFYNGASCVCSVTISR
jgi:hypothetical protein